VQTGFLCTSTSQSPWEASRLEEVQAPRPVYVPKMWKMLRYYWIVARGYRLNPWKSPYLRWRFETFLGPEAAGLDAGKFFHLIWKYRDQMERFVDWAAERRRLQRRRYT
jgi:hypothetical protein